MRRAMAANAASIDPVAARVTPAAGVVRIAAANGTPARAAIVARGISSGTAVITNAAIVRIAAIGVIASA